MADKKSMVHVEKARKVLLKQYGGKHFTNALEHMMDTQKAFGSKFVKFDTLTILEKEQWTKEFVICMMDELSEVLGHINFKHWKKPIYPINEMEVKYELIDLWHFLMNLMLVWGMTAEDVLTMYIAKNRENCSRQERGY